MSDTATTTEIVKFENLQKTASGILISNQGSVEKATRAYNAFINLAKSGMTDELASKGEALAKKMRKTSTSMNDLRKPVTQALDVVKSEFTEKETCIKTFGSNISTIISEYRTAELKKEQEKQRLIKLESDKKIERAAQKASIKNAIEQTVVTWSNGIISLLNKSFDQINLDNASVMHTTINTISVEYSLELHNSFTFTITSLLIQDEMEELIKVTLQELYDDLKKRAEAYLNQKKQELLSRIPSRIEELKLIAEKAKTDASAAKELERKANEKRDLEAKAEEEEAAKKLEEQKKKNQSDSSATQMQASFEVSVAAPKIERKGFSMEITDMSAYANIFQLWFSLEGFKLDSASLEKRTIKQMKTFCEKHAHKNEEFIQHVGIKYNPIAK